MTDWKFGPVSEAPVLSTFLANEEGTLDPLIMAFGIEKTEKMNVKGFEVFSIPPATYAEFVCPLEASAATKNYIDNTWLPSSRYTHAFQGDIEAYFQIPLALVYYARWWIPILNR
jgi:AraC family transcriptional regulator